MEDKDNLIYGDIPDSEEYYGAYVTVNSRDDVAEALSVLSVSMFDTSDSLKAFPDTFTFIVRPCGDGTWTAGYKFIAKC